MIPLYDCVNDHDHVNDHENGYESEKFPIFLHLNDCANDYDLFLLPWNENESDHVHAYESDHVHGNGNENENLPSHDFLGLVQVHGHNCSRRKP